MQRCSLLVCFFLALGASSWAQGDQRNADEQDDFELVQMQRLKFDTSIADEALDKDGSTVTTGNKDKKCSGPGCGQPCDPGICYAFGDPHVYTFDGAGVVLNDKVMNIWLVHSDSVQIQAMSGLNGRLKGLAFGGKWMKDHKLIVSMRGVTFDGKFILPKNGDSHTIPGLVELHRHEKMSLPEKQLKELDGKSNWFSSMRQKMFKWAKKIPVVYHFKLPLDVEIWISGVVWQRQVLIKMAKQDNQAGYCGNFNGDPNDELKPGTNRFWLGMSRAAGTMLDAIEDSEDLFKQANISVGSSMLQSEQITDGELECSEDLMKKAKEACSHIPERMMHDSCVVDICLTKDLTLADGAIEMEMMNAVYAKGSAELQGPGRCLDQDGAKYSTIEDVSISGKMECFMRLHELSHHAELVGKGVRGVQFKTGSCQILAENVTADLLEELPGQWQSQETYSGSGVVSDSDNVEGWTCWKII